MIKKKYIFMIITLIWVAVIFSFSLQHGEVSGEMSGLILRKILALLMPGVLNAPQQLEIWHTVLRKCAHFMEYFILGVLSVITVRQWKVKYSVAVVVGFCVLVASIDETIQIFVSERAGKILDVCIDMS